MTTMLMPARSTADTLNDLARAYGLTSRLVLAPADEELLARLAEPGLLESWPLHRCSETMRGLSSLHRSQVDGESPAALAADYHQLFVAPPARVPAPYESAYRPFETLVLDVPVVDLRDEPGVHGLPDVGAGRREGDHLGVELAVAGRLALAAGAACTCGDADAAAATLQAHRDFLEEHLMRWAPGCLREVEADAATHFYRGAAALALGVLAHAHERLAH